MNIKKQFKEGLITNNPVLVQQIGMCATMAITTSLFNGVGMGLSVLIILTCCNVVISAIRKIIPDEIRLAIFVVVIAGFVTIVDLYRSKNTFMGKLLESHRQKRCHRWLQRMYFQALLPTRQSVFKTLQSKLRQKFLPGIPLVYTQRPAK